MSLQWYHFGDFRVCRDPVDNSILLHADGGPLSQAYNERISSKEWKDLLSKLSAPNPTVELKEINT